MKIYSSIIQIKCFLGCGRDIELHIYWCVVLCLEVSHKLSLCAEQVAAARQHLFYDME
jgi:hypothetical protein